MITSSVVCYRAALHRRRSSASIAVAASGCNQTPGSKDWCILSLNYRNMCSSSSDVVSAPTNKRLNNRRSTSPASTSSSESSNRSSNSSSSSLLAVTSSPSNSSSNSLKSIGLDLKISLRSSSTKNSLESIAGRRVAASPVQSLESLQQCDDNDNFVSNNSSPRHSSSSSSNSSRSSTSSTGGGAHFKCRKALGNRSRIVIITWSHFFCVYLDLKCRGAFLT